MRTFFKVVLFLTVSFWLGACKDDSDNDKETSVSTLSGKISGPLLAGADSVFLYTNNVQDKYVVFSKCPVESDGSFSLKMPAPAYIGSFDSDLMNNQDMTISDRTAKTQEAVLGYKNDKAVHSLYKQNFTRYLQDTIGNAFVIYVYSDRNFTITGTQTITETDLNILFTTKIIYNLHFKKGWNELCFKVDNITITDTAYTIEESLTNDIPSGLTWQYSIFGENVRGKNANKQNTYVGYSPQGLFAR